LQLTSYDQYIQATFTDERKTNPNKFCSFINLKNIDITGVSSLIDNEVMYSKDDKFPRIINGIDENVLNWIGGFLRKHTHAV